MVKGGGREVAKAAGEWREEERKWNRGGAKE